MGRATVASINNGRERKRKEGERKVSGFLNALSSQMIIYIRMIYDALKVFQHHCELVESTFKKYEREESKKDVCSYNVFIAL